MSKKRKHKKSLKKNASALIAFFLLLLSAFTFPLFENTILGENFGGGTVMVNLIKNFFLSPKDFSSTFVILELALVIIFCLIALLYLLNGIGSVYNRYSRYASFLTFFYLVVGLIMYNILNSANTLSMLGFEISSISLGPGIYFIPIIGICYLIFARKINKNLNF